MIMYCGNLINVMRLDVYNNVGQCDLIKKHVSSFSSVLFLFPGFSVDVRPGPLDQAEIGVPR